MQPLCFKRLVEQYATAIPKIFDHHWIGIIYWQHFAISTTNKIRMSWRHWLAPSSPLCSVRIYVQEQLYLTVFILCSITKLIMDTLQLTLNIISHESDYHIGRNFSWSVVLSYLGMECLSGQLCGGLYC